MKKQTLLDFALLKGDRIFFRPRRAQQPKNLKNFFSSSSSQPPRRSCRSSTCVTTSSPGKCGIKREKSRERGRGDEKQLSPLCQKILKNQNSDSPFVRDNNAGGGFVGDADAVGIQVSRYESEDSSGASCSGGIYSTVDDVSSKFIFLLFFSFRFFSLDQKTHFCLSLSLSSLSFSLRKLGLHPPSPLRDPLRATKGHLCGPGGHDGGHRHLRRPLPR